MDTRLRVRLPRAADAEAALSVMRRFFAFVQHLEQSRSHEGATPAAWRFTDAKAGSLELEAAPDKNVDMVLRSVVEGFEAAETRDGFPAGWDWRTGENAKRLAEVVGQADDALEVEWRDGDRVRGRVCITQASARHLSTVLAAKHVAIGSLIGGLDSASTRRHNATLWTDFGDHAVEVRFSDKHTEDIRRAWGKRVEVCGKITSNWRDVPTVVKMTRLEILPSMEDLPALEHYHGRHPDFTGGVDAVEYVRRLRDAS